MRIPGYESAQGLQEAAVGGDFYPLLLTALSAALSPDPEATPCAWRCPSRWTGGACAPGPRPTGAGAGAAGGEGARGGPRPALAAGLALDVGTRDEFSHVPASVRALSAELARQDVPHTFELFDGDHSGQVPGALRSRVLPFCSRVLARQPAPPPAATPSP